MALPQTLVLRAKNSKTLMVSLNPLKMGPCTHSLHGAGMVGIETPLRLNVSVAVLKLQGSQDRVPYRSIVNAADRRII